MKYFRLQLSYKVHALSQKDENGKAVDKFEQNR